jgi:hypothetical protein
MLMFWDVMPHSLVKTKAPHISESSTDVYQTTRNRIPEDHDLEKIGLNSKIRVDVREKW